MDRKFDNIDSNKRKRMDERNGEEIDIRYLSDQIERKKIN